MSRTHVLPRWLKQLPLTLLTLAYPLLIWLGLAHFEPRWLALLLAFMAGLRALTGRDPRWLAGAAVALALAAFGFFANTAWPLKLYPVVINAVLLCVFGMSLWRGPSLIERLARLREPNLPAGAVRYTRKVTWLWCGFFLFNGAMAAYTALAASEQVWALYNGLLSYLLIAALFAGEWLVRQRVRRHFT